MSICRWKVVFGLITYCVASVSYAEENLLEVAPYIAIANQKFTETIREWLREDAEGSWTPSREQVLRAISRIHSPDGRNDILANAQSDIHMEASLERLRESRFQVFGLLVTGHKYLLIDATPLKSTGPDRWLTECISRGVYDGGAAYWWIVVEADSLKVTDCGRRP
jgi:hypothetical protein